MDDARELGDVVDALQEANNALVEASAASDTDAVRSLLADIAALERRRNRIIGRTVGGMQRTTASYEPSVPLRDQVIRALQLIGRPASARLLSDVTKARWAERVDTSKLSSLRRDELRSWRKALDADGRGLRAIYVVPALSADRFTPVRATVALSNWPLEIRLIAPLSPRVDMLHSTIELARETQQVRGTTYEPAMARLVSRLGSTLPGVKKYGAEPAEIITAAESELDVLQPTDTQERSGGAARAQNQLDHEAQLFGAPMRVVAARSKQEAG